jgi:hypothetical protein
LLEDENNIKKPKLALFFYQIVVSTGTSCCVSLRFNWYGVVLADSKCIYVDHLFSAGSIGFWVDSVCFWPIQNVFMLIICFQLVQLVFGSIPFVFGLFIWFFNQFRSFLNQVRGFYGLLSSLILFVISGYFLKALLDGCATLFCFKLELYDHLQLKGEW